MISHYTSINQFLKLYMEESESRVTCANKRATLNVWLGVISAILSLHIAENKKCYLPVTGDRSVFTSRECLDQTGHNEFEVQ